MGAAVADAADMPGMGAPRRIGAGADLDSNAVGLEPGVALPSHLRIGILECSDDARNARRDYGVGAGRRLAVMRAGLERDVHGGATRRGAGPPQRLGLCMRPP